MLLVKKGEWFSQKNAVIIAKSAVNNDSIFLFEWL